MVSLKVHRHGKHKILIFSSFSYLNSILKISWCRFYNVTASKVYNFEENWLGQIVFSTSFWNGLRHTGPRVDLLVTLDVVDRKLRQSVVTGQACLNRPGLFSTRNLKHGTFVDLVDSDTVLKTVITRLCIDQMCQVWYRNNEKSALSIILYSIFIED